MPQRTKANPSRPAGFWSRLRLRSSEKGSDAGADRPAAPAGRVGIRLVVLGLLGAGVLYLSLASVNILVVCTGDTDNPQTADALWVVHWQPLPRKISLLALPPDTLVVLPKRGPMRVSAVYAYGQALNGPAYALGLARAAVENLIGLKLHSIVYLRYSELSELLGQIGGDVQLRPSSNHQNDDSGDERDPDHARQQAWLKRLAVQLFSWSRLPDTLRWFGPFWNRLETDLTWPSALFLGMEIKSITGLPWRIVDLPGHTAYLEGKAFWQADPADIAHAVAALDAGAARAETPPATAETTPVAEPTPEPAATPDSEPSEPVAVVSLPAKIKQPAALKTVPAPADQPVVRILNGCGTPGICKRVADRLTRQGIRILPKQVTNASSFNISASFVKANPKNLPWARRIARILGLEKHIQVTPPENIYPTVTVVVGKDYQSWMH